MRRLLHRLSHWLGWNYGQVITWVKDDFIWVGFRCDTCGAIQHAESTGKRALQGAVQMYLDPKMIHRACGRPFQKHCRLCKGFGVVPTPDGPRRCSCCGCLEGGD